jgi:Tol biopolymer transport system component
MRRLAAVLLMLALMAAFAFGVNRFLASRRASIQGEASVAAPTQARTAVPLPGTLYIAQNGGIFALTDGYFTDLHLPRTGTWMQPAIVPGGQNVLAVLRTDAYSDVYLIDAAGGAIEQLSRNATGSKVIQLNHWMYWPRVSSDGKTFYVSYDSPKSQASYEIDFAVWQGSINGKLAARQLTQPFGYTGGDVAAVPMAGGGILYSKYEISGGQAYSRLAIQTRALADPVYLTDATQDCGQPALSADGAWVAMICAGGTGLQSTRLEVAPLTGTTLGKPRVLVDGCLCAAPAWAPDASGLVYYAPADVTGHFQLWWIAGAAGATPHASRQVTTNLDLDALSPPAWSPIALSPHRRP